MFCCYCMPHVHSLTSTHEKEHYYDPASHSGFIEMKLGDMEGHGGKPEKISPEEQNLWHCNSDFDLVYGKHRRGCE